MSEVIRTDSTYGIARLASSMKFGGGLNYRTASKMKTAGFWRCYLLVLGMSMGGLASSLWQLIMYYGIWEGIISTLLVSVGYLTLDLCLAELVGIIPFAGGNYGFVRCALGPYAGFMAGICEFLFYSFYNSRNIQKMGKLITSITLTNKKWDPLWGLLIHLLVIACQLCGGKILWGSILTTTVFTLVVIVIFWYGSFNHANFYGWAYQHNLPSSSWNSGFVGNSDDYMIYADIAACLFMGLEILPMLSAHVKDEVKVIPKAIMWGWLTMSIISITSIFACSVHYPGVSVKLMTTSFPLQYGITDATGIPTRYVGLLLIPATFASCMGFVFAASNQLAAMADSGLVPKFLSSRLASNGVATNAVLFCGVVEYIVYIILNEYSQKDIPATFRMACIAVCFLHFFLYAAFISFRWNYPHFQRNFINPWGNFSAVVGILIFSYTLVGLAFFQHDNHAVPIAFLIFMILMTWYYIAYVQYIQFFSREEQENFFRAYIINANNNMQRLRHKHRRSLNCYEKMFLTCLQPCGLAWMIEGSSQQARDGYKSSTQVTPTSAGNNNGGIKAQLSKSSSAVAAGSIMIEDNNLILDELPEHNKTKCAAITTENNTTTDSGLVVADGASFSDSTACPHHDQQDGEEDIESRQISCIPLRKPSGDNGVLVTHHLWDEGRESSS